MRTQFSYFLASGFCTLYWLCVALPYKVRHWSRGYVDKISSRIFVTLRYRDEDPIVEKPGAIIIANYVSITIISNQRKTYIYILKDINFINSYTEKSHFAKNMCTCIFYQIYEFTITLTSSCNNYYYVTLMVKLYGCDLR